LLFNLPTLKRFLAFLSAGFGVGDTLCSASLKNSLLTLKATFPCSSFSILMLAKTASLILALLALAMALF
jgi:hypothetical protein